MEKCEVFDRVVVVRRMLGKCKVLFRELYLFEVQSSKVVSCEFVRRIARYSISWEL